MESRALTFACCCLAIVVAVVVTADDAWEEDDQVIPITSQFENKKGERAPALAEFPVIPDKAPCSLYIQQCDGSVFTGSKATFNQLKRKHGRAMQAVLSRISDTAKLSEIYSSKSKNPEDDIIPMPKGRTRKRPVLPLSEQQTKAKQRATAEDAAKKKKAEAKMKGESKRRQELGAKSLKRRQQIAAEKKRKEKYKASEQKKKIIKYKAAYVKKHLKTTKLCSVTCLKEKITKAKQKFSKSVAKSNTYASYAYEKCDPACAAKRMGVIRKEINRKVRKANQLLGDGSLKSRRKYLEGVAGVKISTKFQKERMVKQAVAAAQNTTGLTGAGASHMFAGGSGGYRRRRTQAKKKGHDAKARREVDVKVKKLAKKQKVPEPTNNRKQPAFGRNGKRKHRKGDDRMSSLQVFADVSDRRVAQRRLLQQLSFLDIPQVGIHKVHEAAQQALVAEEDESVRHGLHLINSELSNLQKESGKCIYDASAGQCGKS